MEIKIKKQAERALEFREIEIREPLVEDLIAAERMSEEGNAFSLIVALISRIASFDGKRLPPEDVRRLRVKDFLALSRALTEAGLGDIAEQLSQSRNIQAGEFGKLNA